MIELLKELRAEAKENMDTSYGFMKDALNPEDEEYYHGKVNAYENMMSDLDGRISDIDPSYTGVN